MLSQKYGIALYQARCSEAEFKIESDLIIGAELSSQLLESS